MTSLVSMQKVEKKFGRTNSAHFSRSPAQSPSRVRRDVFSGTTLTIEIVSVQDALEKKISILSGGPFVCSLEVFDPQLNQVVWKQKSSAQFTAKPPIIFGDAFKVRQVNAEWGLDIKPEYILKIQLCKVNEKSSATIDSCDIELRDLIVNKEQQKEYNLNEGNASVTLRLNLSNAQYPRGNTMTLAEITQKEREKDSQKAQEQPAQVEPPLIQRTASYYVPRTAVHFSIPYHTVPGEEVCLVGSIPKLGEWDASKAQTMIWSEGGIWKLELLIRKSSFPFEYKYIVRNNQSGHVRWESISNRKVETSEVDFVNRSDTWDR